MESSALDVIRTFISIFQPVYFQIIKGNLTCVPCTFLNCQTCVDGPKCSACVSGYGLELSSGNYSSSFKAIPAVHLAVSFLNVWLARLLTNAQDANLDFTSTRPQTSVSPASTLALNVRLTQQIAPNALRTDFSTSKSMATVNSATKHLRAVWGAAWTVSSVLNAIRPKFTSKQTLVWIVLHLVWSANPGLNVCHVQATRHYWTLPFFQALSTVRPVQNSFRIAKSVSVPLYAWVARPPTVHFSLPTRQVTFGLIISDLLDLCWSFTQLRSMCHASESNLTNNLLTMQRWFLLVEWWMLRMPIWMFFMLKWKNLFKLYFISLCSEE